MYIHRRERMVGKQRYRSMEQNERLRRASRGLRATGAVVPREAVEGHLGNGRGGGSGGRDPLWLTEGIASSPHRDLSDRVGGLLPTRWCRIVEVGEDTSEAAWGLFVRYHAHVFSFTDCTSFALMRAMGVLEAFTFDRDDFATAGFTGLV